MTDLLIVFASICIFLIGIFFGILISTPSSNQNRPKSVKKHEQKYKKRLPVPSPPVNTNISINLNIRDSSNSAQDDSNIIDVDYEESNGCYKIVSYKDSDGAYRSRAIKSYLDKKYYE